MRRLRTLLCAALVLAQPLVLIPASPAFADPRSMDTDEPYYTHRPGDPNHLPIGCHYLPDHLLAWARSMPAVHRAMDEFTLRGYVAHPVADRALVGCAPDYVSVVYLAYEKPGSFIDSTKAVLPLIMVVSKLYTGSGVARTAISAGLVYFDAATNTIAMADSLDAFRHSDSSFDIEVGEGGGAAEPGIILNSSIQVVTAAAGQSKIGRFMRTMASTASGCVLGAAMRLATSGGVAAVGAVPLPTLGAITVGCLAAGAFSAALELSFLG